MTFYVIGDFHGRSIQDFVQKENPGSNDTVLSTGDFDQTDVINEFLELKDEVGEQSVIDVGGNHDHALVEKRGINSGTITSQGKSFKQMVRELKADKDAEKYLEGILENKIKEFKLGDMNGVLVHGGLAGYLQNPDIEEEIRPLWYRLWDEEDFVDNFDIMKEEGYEIEFRGHDHWFEHSYLTEDGSESPGYNLPEAGDSIRLDSSNRHIITHGPWYEGKYLAVDEDNLEVNFKEA